MKPVPHERLLKEARNIMKGLMLFSLMNSPSAEKQAAINKLRELRLQVQETLDVLVPDWAEE